LRVIAELEFLKHLVSKLGHRDLLVTPTISDCLHCRTHYARVASAAPAAQFKRRSRPLMAFGATINSGNGRERHNNVH
jgi:hypothetical protein